MLCTNKGIGIAIKLRIILNAINIASITNVLVVLNTLTG
jgi:hypothetical protein